MLEAHYMLTHLHINLHAKLNCKVSVEIGCSGGWFCFFFRYDLFKFIQLDLKL